MAAHRDRTEHPVTIWWCWARSRLHSACRRTSSTGHQDTGIAVAVVVVVLLTLVALTVLMNTV